jgi:hypothetical protein
MLKEPQIDPSQLDEIRGWIRHATDDNERPRVVISAIAVLGAWGGVEGVFPKTPMIGHSLQMIETRRRQRI